MKGAVVARASGALDHDSFETFRVCGSSVLLLRFSGTDVLIPRARRISSGKLSVMAQKRCAPFFSFFDFCLGGPTGTRYGVASIGKQTEPAGLLRGWPVDGYGRLLEIAKVCCRLM